MENLSPIDGPQDVPTQQAVDDAANGAKGYADTQDDAHSTADRAYTDAGLAAKIGDAPSDGKSYVRKDADWAVAESSGGGDYLPLSGGTLTGNLSLPSLDSDGVASVSEVASQAGPYGGASPSVVIPAGTQEGDLLLVAALTANTSSTSFTDTDGFVEPIGFTGSTHFGQAGSTREGGRWYWKVAGPADTPGTQVTFTRSASQWGGLALVVLRNADTPAETAWEYFNGGSGKTLAAGALTMSAEGMLLAVCASQSGQPTSTWGTVSLETDVGNAKASIRYGITGAGASPEVAFTDADSSGGAGLLLVPGVAVGTPVLVGSALDMQGNEVTAAADPTTPQSLATKEYVDSSDGNYLPLSGGTMTGKMLLADTGEPTEPLEPAPAGYVLPHSGGIMTGPLFLSGSIPLTDRTAVDKGYVDGKVDDALGGKAHRAVVGTGTTDANGILSFSAATLGLATVEGAIASVHFGAGGGLPHWASARVASSTTIQVMVWSSSHLTSGQVSRMPNTSVTLYVMAWGTA